MLPELCPVTYANVKSNDSKMNNLSFTVSYFTLTSIFYRIYKTNFEYIFQFSFSMIFLNIMKFRAT